MRSFLAFTLPIFSPQLTAINLARSHFYIYQRKFQVSRCPKINKGKYKYEQIKFS